MIHRFWFYLTLVLLPTQLGLHLWPEWAHLLGRRIDYLSPTIYLTNITILATLIFWAWENRFVIPNLFRDHIEMLKRVQHDRNHVDWKILLMGTFIILNISFSLSPPVALLNWLHWLLLGLWAWYIMRTKPDRHLVILTISISVIWSSVIALFQWQHQQALGGLLWLLGERWYTPLTPGLARTNWCFWWVICREVIRSYATFPHPNVLAGYLVALWPLLWLYRQKSKIITLALCLIPFALFTTLSRSSWLVWLITILLLIILRIKYKIHTFSQNILNSLFMSSLIVIVGLIIFFPYLRTLNLQSESVTLRQTLFKTAWEIWSASPFLGTGLGASLLAYPKIIPQTAVYVFQPVHSVPLLLLTELGIFGVTILIILLFKVRTRLSLSSPFILSIFALVLLSLFDHYPLTLQQGQLLTTLLLAFLLQ